MTFAPGFLLSGEFDDAVVDEAVAAAEASDVVVACLGLVAWRRNLLLGLFVAVAIVALARFAGLAAYPA